jgi:molybdopterin-containing oxidoreductase family iron-sulfur binding subunit
MIACPYKARSFVFKETHDWTNKDVPKRMHGVVEKCDLCVHRIDKEQKPACVEACANANKGAMVFGDLNDTESEISKLIANNAVQQIRADLGLKPKVYYIGL